MSWPLYSSKKTAKTNCYNAICSDVLYIEFHLMSNNKELIEITRQKYFIPGTWVELSGGVIWALWVHEDCCYSPPYDRLSLLVRRWHRSLRWLQQVTTSYLQKSVSPSGLMVHSLRSGRGQLCAAILNSLYYMYVVLVLYRKPASMCV